ncbi:MAG TPA: DEAD/DEAH box helicase [Chloroflexota bacterium]|nr:DEAD/DEAH box helicase [Chloroflexota bacterium]
MVNVLTPSPTVEAATSRLTGFHPAIAEWFARRFPDGPTDAQSRGWALIARGQDTLIAAPTGSGKTLAGFLVAIDSLYRAHSKGVDTVGATRVVYVSPLKALAVDIAHNLDQPLAEISIIARQLGYEPAPITVAVRTGDTSPTQRQQMLRRRPSLVVTTPESLYLLLTSKQGRDALATVETVIIDEIHAVARDKRGAHLALSLERLEALCKRHPVRIGLSATQRPIDVVGRLLVGDRPSPAVVDVGHQRDLDLALELPEGELEAVASADQFADVVNRIAALVQQHRTTLVFVNTRYLAERVAHQLGQRLGDDVVAAHHGSLSRERRLRVETRLRAGDLKALVATASLELGIDIGPVELVCQIGSPRSIATFLQRVGRSNHSRLGTPKGRLYPLTRDELVECTALLTAVRAGRLDAIVPARLPLDIAAQQMIAEVAASECSTDSLYDLVRRAAPYADLPRAQFDDLLELITKGIETGRGRRGAYLHHDAVNGELRARKSARLAAATSGGAIPEVGDYRVLADPDDTLIGSVNEDWAVESNAGDIFLLGTHSWQIRKVEPGVVRVRDAGNAPPTVPFWRGEAPARTAELSEEVSRLRQRVDERLATGEADQAHRELVGGTGIDGDAAAMIVDYLAAGRAALGIMPTQQDLVLERFFDDTGGMQLVLHSPFGARVNRGLGLVLRKKFCRTFNFELQAAATDDAIVLSLGLTHSFPLEDVPRFLASRTLDDTLEHAILDSPMFQARWRWNLNRSLMVLRWRNGRRNPPPIQRMESDDLMAAVFPQAAACQDNIVGPIEIPDHVLVRQTIDDTLHEAIDIDGVRALLQSIEAGEVRMHCRDTTEPSVLAHEIISAKPYAFLDDEETQNRRTNAVRLRRGLPTDLAIISSLSPEAIERVHSEIVPVLETADDLHDLLSATLLLQPRAEWTLLFEHLRLRGRAHVLNGLWTTTESLAEAREALNGAHAAVMHVLRGHLELTGITTVAALSEATSLPREEVAVGLAALEHEGFAMQGQYRPGASSTEWVARRLLARMHGYSKQSRREAFQPVSAQDFMRFVLCWQHVAPGTQLSGDGGLIAVLEQLQGFEAPAAAWESELLARRLSYYDPAWLDALCHAGEVAWLRLTPRTDDAASAVPSKATPTAVVLRTDLPWLLAAARSADNSLPAVNGATGEVLQFLRERGASFLSDIATALRCSPEAIERALWDGVGRGLVMCDGFAAIRSLIRVRGQVPPRSFRLSTIRRRATMSAVVAGRWSLVPPPDVGIDRHDLAEAVAEQLLNRWGVLFRDLAVHEGARLPWRELQWALRRHEDRGLVRGGRFVGGFSGEQYALPGAVEQLTRVRKAPRSGERVVVNAADPLNLVGVIVPGATIPAVRTNHVVYADGLPEPPSAAV